MSFSEIMSSISNLVSFVGEKASANLAEANRTDRLDLSDAQLRTVINIVEASVSQAYSLSGYEVEKTIIKNIDK